jgi:hypothetical protein
MNCCFYTIVRALVNTAIIVLAAVLIMFTEIIPISFHSYVRLMTNEKFSLSDKLLELIEKVLNHEASTITEKRSLFLRRLILNLRNVIF